MPKYVWTAKHTFKSENNLKKHLKRDEKHFLKILNKLKKYSKTIVIDEGISHLPFLFLETKKVYYQAPGLL